MPVDNLGIELGNSGKTISWGLYVHVPFCDYRCRYCDFYFETTRSTLVHGRLVDAVLRDAAGQKAAQEETWGKGLDTSPRTLYLGGGTPSVLALPLLKKLLDGLSDLWGRPREEGTMEANPEGVSPGLLDLLQESGVRRLSLGVQSLDQEVLRALGRRAWREVSLGALDLVCRTWGGSWNLDIMTGLPGQTWPKLRDDLDRLVDFAPGHVSLYSLTLEPGTPLEGLVDRGQVVLPVEDLADGLWLKARDYLVDRGWDWYEISNFARPGEEGKHNQGYWRMEPCLGLGPGAHGTLRDPGSLRAVRTVQPRLGDYLRGEGASREVLEPREFFLEHLITGLRTREGLSLEKIRRRFGVDLREVWKDRWAQWEARGMLAPGFSEGRGESLALTPAGRLVLDTLLQELAALADGLTPAFGKLI